MDFRFRGLDDIQKFLDDYKKELDPQIFDGWARCVAETAKEMCDDPACKHIKPLQRQQDSGKLSLNFEFADEVVIDCLLKAIDQLQKSMPPSLQQIYKELRIQLEAKKAGF
jgi:hypothetical protein